VVIIKGLKLCARLSQHFLSKASDGAVVTWIAVSPTCPAAFFGKNLIDAVVFEYFLNSGFSKPRNLS
jgi:hypothetical protein